MEKIGNAIIYHDNTDVELNPFYDELIHKYEKYQFDKQKIMKYCSEEILLQEFSDRRGNIVRWLTFEDEMEVLEIGSGCGAVTEVLFQKKCNVTCIEKDIVKSRINAYRNGENNAFSIYPELSCLTAGKTYDLILIWEIETMDILKKIKDLLNYLKKDGQVLIAFENKYSLRKWAGYRQKFRQSMFEENRKTEISWKEIKKIEKELESFHPHIYYPYPDEKHMIAMYSDEFLPVEGELFKNEVPFMEGRLEFFQEARGFDQLIKDDMFPIFSNSYVLLLGGK